MWIKPTWIGGVGSHIFSLFFTEGTSLCNPVESKTAKVFYKTVSILSGILQNLHNIFHQYLIHGRQFYIVQYCGWWKVVDSLVAGRVGGSISSQDFFFINLTKINLT